MKKLVQTREAKAEFLRHYRYILCDERIKRDMSFTFGEAYLNKGHIIPVKVNEVPIEKITRSMNLLLRSYVVRISGCALYPLHSSIMGRECRIGRTMLDNKTIIANYNAVHYRTASSLIGDGEGASVCQCGGHSFSLPKGLVHSRC